MAKIVGWVKAGKKRYPIEEQSRGELTPKERREFDAVVKKLRAGDRSGFIPAEKAFQMWKRKMQNGK